MELNERIENYKNKERQFLEELQRMFTIYERNLQDSTNTTLDH